MYKLSVPVMSATVNKQNREEYVRLCREAGAERVFLAVSTIEYPVPDSLSENVACFKEQGFEVGIWTETLGHGSVLEHVEKAPEEAAFSPLVDTSGAVRNRTCCPLDESLRAFISRYIAALAETGADIIMLDDDFRMGQKGEHLCCACDAHMELVGKLLGEEITREEILPYIYSGKGNRYRDAWLSAQNEALTLLAKDIRAAVDQHHPEVMVCICTNYSAWNSDGMDVANIARILAGKQKPLLRLTGAPYWAAKKRRYSLVAVFEIARMLASFVKGEGIELMSEGDVYPRPRYTCPASYLELYDMVGRIDGGYDGILKYMFDYVAGPQLEQGYLALHGENRPYTQILETMFRGGANAGVRIIARPHTIRDADHDLVESKLFNLRPLDGTMLGSCGIPTIYSGKGVCISTFGENARRMPLDELENGAVLDAVSACILTERGVDVGLEKVDGFVYASVPFLCTEDESFKSFISDGMVRVPQSACKAEAEVVLFASSGKELQPFAYRYENENGQRFLVFLFDGASIAGPESVCLSGLAKNYVTQKVLMEGIPWVARKPLPARCEKNPELYLMCRQDAGSMSVALFNAFADPVLYPVVYLGEQYDRIECLGCEAELDGDKVILKSRLHGFDSAAFRVYKE